jgi:hypothetical protein
MQYRTVYDIALEPAVAIEAVWLSAGFILVGTAWAVIRRFRDQQRETPAPRTGTATSTVLIGFGVLIAVIGVGLMGWDHWRLVQAVRKGEARVVEGPIQSWSTERVRRGSSSKREYNTYEQFYVGDSIWFGYYQDVGQAGFHNGKRELVPLANGMRVRASYLYADGRDKPPRIVKLEVAAPAERVR